ncbi:sensor histidine kinase [Labrys wisconsinensis]|uniref:histidine kinase n=1 Tax=Labrys wisconsinensis TaxID=425677 RepID=A0ABU0JBC5_9HYPH|nr:HAMP domain-containing sensor histidine kinase [Labrys wisconsinensis]MDQ0471576.1 signal transduction histidine kinase [Labrys wisconsinensis]
MRLAERLVPRSITTQITGLVAVSVLLGMIVTVAIVVLLYGTTPPDDSPPAVASRIVRITQFVKAAKTPAEADIVLTAVRNAGVRVDQVALSELEPLPGGAGWPWWTWPLLQQVRSAPGVEILDRRYPAGPAQQLVVRRDAGHALVFDAATDASPWRLFLTPTALILTIVLIFVLLLSIYAVRWIIAPLAAVAAAAQSFGRSPQDVQPIAGGGPREIAQVADALNEMRTRIGALLDDRTRMLAAIGHDLRTPLTRLRLRSERVHQDKLREGMLADLANVERMLDETLDYLREDGRSEALSRVDLPSLLQTICSQFVDVGHAVAYRGPGKLVWTVQPRALTRAVTNIVENGVKHAGTVTATLRGRADRIEIEVADDGPGIPAELRERVFEPFFKADAARTQDGGGFGLGLSIARDIVQRHGGTISLANRDPRGLKVRIHLPAGAGRD